MSGGGLLILGAGGLAREVLSVVELLGRHREVTLLDDDPARWGTQVQGSPVAGETRLVREYPDHEVLVCLGRGAARRALVERMTADGVLPRWARIVHPQVPVPGSCTVGPGSVLLAGVVLTADVSVGSHVVAMPNVVLTHDAVVADYATLCAGVTLAGDVTVGEGAYLGTASSVREHVSVGADAVLGMGAVALQDVPAAETWVGVPARPMTRREVGR